MRKILTVVGTVLFVGALLWLYHRTGFKALLAAAGVTTGVLIRVLWLDSRREPGTPPEHARDHKDADPPDTA